MKESVEKNWREWSKNTTDRDGRERDVEEYEGFLGFRKENLRGKKILDIGTGETELFSRELRDQGIDTNIVSLNPDYSGDRFRQRVKKFSGWRKESVAAIGQELPFKEETFDYIFALYSLSVFAYPSRNFEAAQRWISEIVRVLKPGGEARVAPLWIKIDKNQNNQAQLEEKEYQKLIDSAVQLGVVFEIQPITIGEVLPRDDKKSDLSPWGRLIIKKSKK